MIRKPIDPDYPQMNRKPILAWLLSLVGGFTDAYTFLLFGNVFVAGQTGNVIFLTANLADHNWHESLLKLVIILTFSFGMICSAIWTKWMDRSHYWRIYALGLEFLVMITVGFLPMSVSAYFKLPLLAFAMAFQYSLYDQVENVGYANVFTTANLKKATLNLAAGVLYQQPIVFKQAKIYFKVITCFILGALFGSFLSHIFGERTIWFAAILVLIAGLIHFHSIRKKELKYQW